MRYSSSYRDYNYDKIYDNERDGCGEVSRKFVLGHLGSGLTWIWFPVWFWVGHVYIQGFEWNDSFQACVDIDECSTGSAACGDNKVCTGVHCGAF